MFGDPHAPAVLLLPTWQIAPSLHWKPQVPYLARSFRVATFDPPGTGGAERTAEPAAFELDRVVDYGVDLLDHLDVRRASVVGLSMGDAYGLWMAGRYPDRVTWLTLMSTVPPEWALGEDPSFWQRRDSYPSGVSMFRTRKTRLAPGALCTPGTAVSTRPAVIPGRRLPHLNGQPLPPWPATRPRTHR